MPPASRINFFFSGSKPNIGHRLKLKKFIRSIFNEEGKQMESINIVFSNDAELLRLNKEYLNHDYLTDIVTFELSPRGKPKTGDLYISYDRVRENAYQHTTSFKHELHRVIIHGVLHLCGYKDKTKAQTKAIRNRENFYLDKYFG